MPKQPLQPTPITLPNPLAVNAQLYIVQPALKSAEVMKSVKMQLFDAGFVNVPYDRVMFTFHPSFASQHLLAVGNWDEARRNAARTVLQQARENFHKHPRPW